jgi:lysophospholipase
MPSAERQAAIQRSAQSRLAGKTQVSLIFEPNNCIRWWNNDLPYNDARLRTLLTAHQHLAATSPNVEILQDFLAQGASVHLRNRAGNTPLFLAASAGLKDHVQTLLDAGAHLHSDEVSAARLHVSEADGAPGLWESVIG